MALSHCWGGTSTATLTMKTMTTFLDSIPLRTLPRTFRDAIDIARRLSSPYLWIDSLCIIQDSEDDWRHESAMMGEVYRNSWCTIAAARASNSNMGCYVDRNPVPLRICKLPGNLFSTDPGEKIYVYRYELDCWDDINHAPLNSRAWVLQERILSPRVLHYGSEQIFWECQTHSATESYPLGLSPWAHEMAETRFKSMLSPPTSAGRPGVLSIEEDPDPLSLLYADWIFTVNIYSKTKLTKPKDK